MHQGEARPLVRPLFSCGFGVNSWDALTASWRSTKSKPWTKEFGLRSESLNDFGPPGPAQQSHLCHLNEPGWLCYKQSLQRATWPLMKSRQGQILWCVGWAPAQLKSRRSPWNTQCLLLGWKDGTRMSLYSSELWQVTLYLRGRERYMRQRGWGRTCPPHIAGLSALWCWGISHCPASETVSSA